MRLQASLIALATIFGALVLDQPSSSAATATMEAADEIRSAHVFCPPDADDGL